MAGADIHVDWRMRVAHRVARPYLADPTVAAVVVAGSVARGRADRYSDLEIDVYWTRSPTDAARLAAVERCCGEVTQFWAYSADDEEWAEEYTVDGLWIGLSHFMTSTVSRFIHDVVDGGDASDLKQMRISAIRDGVALSGEDRVKRWRAATDRYPDVLARAMVGRHLHEDALDGWHNREALLERNDLLMLHALLVRVEHAVLGTLSGINRVYVAHSAMKWQNALADTFTVAPDDLRRRLVEVFLAPPRAGVEELERLLAETLVLVEGELPGIDLSTPRRLLARTRPALDPPDVPT